MQAETSCGCIPALPCRACLIARDAERDRKAQAIVDLILASAGCPKKEAR